MLFKGFCQVKIIPKIREKYESGWVGQAPTRISFIFGNIVFFCVVFFDVHVSKKIKIMDRLVGGWVGEVWTIRVFLGFLIFFNLTTPLTKNRLRIYLEFSLA